MRKVHAILFAEKLNAELRPDAASLLHLWGIGLCHERQRAPPGLGRVVAGYAQLFEGFSKRKR
jgi:hypothetical protein